MKQLNEFSHLPNFHYNEFIEGKKQLSDFRKRPLLGISQNKLSRLIRGVFDEN